MKTDLLQKLSYLMSNPVNQIKSSTLPKATKGEVLFIQYCAKNNIKDADMSIILNRPASTLCRWRHKLNLRKYKK